MAWYLLKKRRHLGPYGLNELKEMATHERADFRDYVISASDYEKGLLKYQSLQDLLPDLRKIEEKKAAVEALNREAQVPAPVASSSTHQEWSRSSSVQRFAQLEAEDFVQQAPGPMQPSPESISNTTPSSMAVAQVAEPDSVASTGAVFLLRMENFPRKRAFYSAAVFIGALLLWRIYPSPTGSLESAGRKEASQGAPEALDTAPSTSSRRRSKADLQIPKSTRAAPETPRPEAAGAPVNNSSNELPPVEAPAHNTPDPNMERADLQTMEANPVRPNGLLPQRNQSQNLNEMPNDGAADVQDANGGNGFDNAVPGTSGEAPLPVSDPGFQEEYYP